MATYKVWLTVKDSYGNIKEVDGGTINVSLEDDDVDAIVESIKDNIAVEAKSPVYVPEVTPDNMLKFTLTEEATEETLEFDIDKSNDWNMTDSTTGSSYVWEQMQAYSAATAKSVRGTRPESSASQAYLWEPMK